MGSHRLIVVAGPSCAGKTPLWDALRARHPELVQNLRSVVLYNDRAPRPGETDGEDYHFRDRDTIASKGDADDFVVCEVRGDLQGVDLSEQLEKLAHSDLLYEGNPMMGRMLLRHRALRDVERLGIFVSPVSTAELAELGAMGARHARSSITKLMRRRLMRRAQRKYDMVDLPRLRDIETRATSAYDELAMAHEFDHVLVNHDGEDSDHWDLTGTVLGSARRSVEDLAELLGGHQYSRLVERWTESTLPRVPRQT